MAVDCGGGGGIWFIDRLEWTFFMQSNAGDIVGPRPT